MTHLWARFRGWGYTYPNDYAKQFDASARTRLFGEFLGLTRDALPRSDLKQIWIMGVSQPELLNRYAAELPGIDAIFPDYGKRLDRNDETIYPAVRGVPVFHAVTHWEEEGTTRSRKVDQLVDELRRASPAERPAFLHAFIWNWGADLSILPEVMERLGPQDEPNWRTRAKGLRRNAATKCFSVLIQVLF